MKVVVESNLSEVLDGTLSKGIVSIIPIAQIGIEKVERFSAPIFGQIAKIHSLEGSKNRPKSGKCVIHTYSLEITAWKLIPLVAFLPFLFIQSIFRSATSPMVREVTVQNVQIVASRGLEGISMEVKRKN